MDEAILIELAHKLGARNMVLQSNKVCRYHGWQKDLHEAQVAYTEALNEYKRALNEYLNPEIKDALKHA